MKDEKIILINEGAELVPAPEFEESNTKEGVRERFEERFTIDSNGDIGSRIPIDELSGVYGAVYDFIRAELESHKREVVAKIKEERKNPTNELRESVAEIHNTALDKCLEIIENNL
jgi:hypothetical protein